MVNVVALLPFRNEACNLPRVMTNLRSICQIVLGYDSDSIDGSAEIFQALGGILVKIDSPKTYFEGGEHEIRTVLLNEARSLGATHFIFLDCDEYFSEEFLRDARNIISKMSPGEKIALEWVNLWGDEDNYCVQGPWAPKYKDFIMCDDLLASYPYTTHHVPRSPTSITNLPWIDLPRNLGVVIHTQFVDQFTFQCKQILCRMAELLNSKKSAYNINITYADTLELNGTTQKIPPTWKSSVAIEHSEVCNWRVQEIKKLFEIYGISFFEELDIWHLDFMKEYWFSQSRRHPKVANRKRFSILMKLIVYRFRVMIGYKFDK